jgi:hypothetical protein
MTLLILYSISSKLATLLKHIDVPTQVSDIFNLSVSFKIIDFSFEIFLLFFREMSICFTSYVV